MTFLDDLLHDELIIEREKRDIFRAKVWIATILIEAFEYRLGYSADCPQAMDMIFEGSPVNYNVDTK